MVNAFAFGEIFSQFRVHYLLVDSVGIPVQM